MCTRVLTRRNDHNAFEADLHTIDRLGLRIISCATQIQSPNETIPIYYNGLWCFEKWLRFHPSPPYKSHIYPLLYVLTNLWGHSRDTQLDIFEKNQRRNKDRKKRDFSAFAWFSGFADTPRYLGWILVSSTG